MVHDSWCGRASHVLDDDELFSPMNHDQYGADASLAEKRHVWMSDDSDAELVIKFLLHLQSYCAEELDVLLAHPP